LLLYDIKVILINYSLLNLSLSLSLSLGNPGSIPLLGGKKAYGVWYNARFG